MAVFDPHRPPRRRLARHHHRHRHRVGCGPLPDADAAKRLLVEQFARWERKARAAGGHTALQADGVLVTLPRMSGKPKGALPN